VCVKSLAETLSISPDRIELDTKFSRLGLDSGLSVFLLLELEDRLGVTLVPEAFYDNQTVAELCEHIAGIVGRAESPGPQPGESPAQ
jgi:acyl carrier protein